MSFDSVEAVEALLRAGADVNAQNRIMGSTPLHMAAQSNKGSAERMTQTVELLLRHGADLQKADSKGATPYDYAVLPEIMAKLQPQMPPLYQAIDQVDLPLFQAALEKSDSKVLNEIQFASKTPLDYTVDRIIALTESQQGIDDLASIFHRLIQNGALSNQTTTHTLLLSLDQAYKMGLDDHIQALKQIILSSLEHHTEGATLSMEACLLAHQVARRGNLPMLRFLLDQLNVDPNICNRQQMTILHFAARSGQTAVVEYLLYPSTSTNALVDVNAKDSLGKTALDSARINGKSEVVMLLERYLGISMGNDSET